MDGIPIAVPVIAVEGAAERGHAVDAADAPAGAGLFEPAADQILRCPFHRAAADRAACGRCYKRRKRKYSYLQRSVARRRGPRGFGGE